MLKTLLAGAATAALLAFGAQAQESPAPAAPGMTAPETTPPPLAEDEMNPEAEAGTPQTAEDSEALSPATPQTAEDADPLAPADTAADTAPAPAGPLPEGAIAVDLATVTPDTLIGADIRTYEGDAIAAVDDVTVSAEGKVDDVVARFGGFLGFGETKVLLAPEDLTAVREADDTVVLLTGLTAEELQARTEYTAPETLGPEG
ncbi:MAG TPA: PRC-barrel domain-containing protein [Amaricoccus sp.]|nr:PRC-barrel domain-containing protein [Amaricoccus sp.]